MSDAPLPWELSLPVAFAQIAAAHARRLLRDAEVHYGLLMREGTEIPGIGKVKLVDLSNASREALEERIAALRFAVTATERESISLFAKLERYRREQRQRQD